MLVCFMPAECAIGDIAALGIGRAADWACAASLSGYWWHVNCVGKSIIVSADALELVAWCTFAFCGN